MKIHTLSNSLDQRHALLVYGRMLPILDDPIVVESFKGALNGTAVASKHNSFRINLDASTLRLYFTDLGGVPEHLLQWYTTKIESMTSTDISDVYLGIICGYATSIHRLQRSTEHVPVYYRSAICGIDMILLGYCMTYIMQAHPHLFYPRCNQVFCKRLMASLKKTLQTLIARYISDVNTIKKTQSTIWNRQILLGDIPIYVTLDPLTTVESEYVDSIERAFARSKTLLGINTPR